MDDNDFAGREKRLQETARSYEYPPTPDIAHRAAGRLALPRPARPGPGRRYVWGTALILAVLLIAMLAVPPVRAAVLEFIQVGAMRIFFAPASTTVSPLTVIPSLLDLAGATTLSEAQEKASFPILLPSYPPDLGEPDRVFVQRVGGPVVILIWTEPGPPEQIRLSLMLLGQGAFASKGAPPVVEQTTVNDTEALWMRGSHFLLLYLEGSVEPTPVAVEGNVLVWEDGEVTYRIESNLPLEEALRIAESLR